MRHPVFLQDFIMYQTKPVADPGFPVGGRGPRSGGVDSRGSYVSKILYVKTKESGPLGGGGTCAGHAPSISANANHGKCCKKYLR